MEGTVLLFPVLNLSRVVASVIPSLAIVGLLFFLMRGTLGGVKGAGGGVRFFLQRKSNFIRAVCSELPILRPNSSQLT